MFYRLPRFVSQILAAQPSAPRDVPLISVAGAVLAGFDCAVYLVGAVFLAAGGWKAVTVLGPGSGWLGPALFVVAGSLVLLVAYRIWSVRRALQAGEAGLAEVTQVENGIPRWWGTPWGDVGGSRYGAAAAAAKGAYRLVTSAETGRYYMQQKWALSLVPGDRIWVVRLNGRDTLYAPASSPTPR